MEYESAQEIRDEIKRFGGLPLTHDVFFREVFEMFEIAKEFLQFAIPQRILDKLDLNDLERESRDFLNNVFREKRVDVLCRVSMMIGKKRMPLFILVEHKSKNEFHTIFQMNQYVGVIGQHEIRIAIEEERFGSEFRLTPVLVIIFYHGPSPFSGALDSKDVYEPNMLEDATCLRTHF